MTDILWFIWTIAPALFVIGAFVYAVIKRQVISLLIGFAYYAVVWVMTYALMTMTDISMVGIVVILMLVWVPILWLDPLNINLWKERIAVNRMASRLEALGRTGLFSLKIEDGSGNLIDVARYYIDPVDGWVLMPRNGEEGPLYITPLRLARMLFHMGIPVEVKDASLQQGD